MKKLILVVAALSAVTALTACGPEQSAADKDRQQVAEEVSQQRAVVMPFVGTYYGTLTESNGTVDQAQLDLREQDVLVSNPSRNEPSVVPTLIGGLDICLTTSTCFKPQKTDEARKAAQIDLFNVGQFNLATYDGPTQTLVLSFGASGPSGTSGSTVAAPSSPYGTMILNLKVNGGHLTGNASSTIKPNFGTLDVTRAK